MNKKIAIAAAAAALVAGTVAVAQTTQPSTQTPSPAQAGQTDQTMQPGAVTPQATPAERPVGAPATEPGTTPGATPAQPYETTEPTSRMMTDTQEEDMAMRRAGERG